MIIHLRVEEDGELLDEDSLDLDRHPEIAARLALLPLSVDMSFARATLRVGIIVGLDLVMEQLAKERAKDARKQLAQVLRATAENGPGR